MPPFPLPQGPRSEPKSPEMLIKRPGTHINLRLGMRHLPEGETAALLESPYLGKTELSVGSRVFEDLYLDLSWSGASREGKLYQWIDTRLRDNALTLQLNYRRALIGPLLMQARLGPAYHWLEMEFEQGEESLLAEENSWGASAALGLIFLPIHSSLIPKLKNSSFGLGLSVELNYDWLPEIEFGAEGARLGSSDLSGLGWCVSNVIQF